MPHQTPAPLRAPTPYEGLNAVLAHFLAEVTKALGENFIGLYLQGSFAVGDADVHSDCDFLAVVERDLTPAEIAALQAMHDAIHSLAIEPWSHRLEGSYAPREVIRRIDAGPVDPPGEPRGPDWTDPGLGGAPAQRYPFVYLDHGARVLVRSEHDNTNVVRWSLRECGVVLHGPDPKSLVDPVTPAMLRAEVMETLDLVDRLGLEPMTMKAWQSFWVGLHCRMLHSLASGKVTSKKAATAWAVDHLDAEWRPLIASAQAIKEGDREIAMQPPEPAAVEASRAFHRYAREKAQHDAAARDLITRQLEAKRRGQTHGAKGWSGAADAGGKTRPAYAPPPYRSHDRGKRG